MWAPNARLIASLAFAAVVSAGMSQVTWTKNKDEKVFRKAREEARRVRDEYARAREMLARSMRQARNINVVAIITKMSDDALGMQRVKLEQTAEGFQMGTVLQPLRFQGVMFTDDGRKSTMYLPDQRLVIESQALADMEQELSFRMELLEQNYQVRAEQSEPIAGRPTFRVVAEPKRAGLPARQFYLDQQNFYPLRIAAEEPNGEWKVYRDTQMVTYPAKMAAPFTKFNPPGAAQTIRYAAPKPLDQVRNKVARLGFDPVVPSRLPFGFKVQSAELRQNDGGQLAVLRLTDGLATAMVYQYRCSDMREGIWSKGTATVLTEDGVTFDLRSDLDPSVRQQLLKSFAKGRPEQIAPPSQGTFTRVGVRREREPNSPKQLFTPAEPQVFGAPQPCPAVPVMPARDIKGNSTPENKGE